MAEVETRIEKAAGAATRSTPSQTDVQGKIIEAVWQLKKNGYSESTIHHYSEYLRMLLKRGANLYDPESVKEVIARQENWGSSSKLIAAHAYAFFANLNGIHWTPPRYKADRKLPFIPLESEIDALIASSSKKTAATLQLLKETGMRIGEACRIKWIDLDLERNVIALNEPEKNSEPRLLKISARLAAMLNALPRIDEYVFARIKPRSVASNIQRLRKRVAHRLQNPRILSIHLHTFRHWHATMEYHRTRDILHVMKRLGHKRIANTLLYTQLISFESDEYNSAVAESMDEARKLTEAGFEYVCTHEGSMLFRKRK